MYCNKINVFAFKSSRVLIETTRFYSSETVNQILSKYLHLHPNATKTFIEKNRIKRLNHEQLQETLDVCNQLGFKWDEVLNNPKLLNRHASVLLQHYLVCKEGGFENVTASILVNFRKFVYKPVDTLKLMKLIPDKVNVVDSFLSHLNPHPTNLLVDDLKDDELAWSYIHTQIIKRYLMWKFNYTTEEIERLFRINSILKGKSLKQLCENIKIAEDLGFTPEKLLRFGQILRNNPLYPKRTLKENPTIAGMDLAKAMLACPRLISVVPRNYNKIYATLKKAGISDETIRKTMNVFILSPETVARRLKEVQTIPELKIHLSNPQFLQIIVYYARAKTRLEFLRKVKLKCTSLHVIGTNNDETFETHIREGKDTNTIRDVFLCVKKLLNTDKETIEKNLRLHPYFLRVPLVQIEESIQYLWHLKFKSEVITDVVQIILYPKDKLKVAHSWINTNANFVNLHLNAGQKLNLMLYYMEKDHHFTGNGIWFHYPET